MDGFFGMLILFVFLLMLYSLPTLIFCRLIMAFVPKDAPDNDRKTQAYAVPSSGGIAIVFVAFCWWLTTYPFDDIIRSACMPIDAFECLPIAERYASLSLWPHLYLWLGVTLLGAIDDARALSAKLKFATLGLLTLLATSFGASIDGVFMPVADAYFVIPLWLGIGGAAIWIFVMMNATNFMDGSNGLAMGSLAIMMGGLAFRFPGNLELSSDIFQITLTIIFAILGFLFWNLQGKLYAGDAGSLFGGAVFASLGIFAAKDGNIWLPATLALPFLIDVLMTLLWRASRRENLLQAHRDHAYQGLIKSGWSHIKTALLWWTFAAICAGAALWAAGDSKATSAYVFLGLLSLGCVLWLAHRAQQPDKAARPT